MRCGSTLWPAGTDQYSRAAVGSRQENHCRQLVRGRTLLAFFQVMAIACADCQPVNGSEFVDLFQRFRTEWLFSLECMKDDAFQQISYGHILEFCRRFQDFQNPALNANARLNAFDFYLFGSTHSSKCTMVQILLRRVYLCTIVYWTRNPSVVREPRESAPQLIRKQLSKSCSQRSRNFECYPQRWSTVLHFH